MTCTTRMVLRWSRVVAVLLSCSLVHSIASAAPSKEEQLNKLRLRIEQQQKALAKVEEKYDDLTNGLKQLEQRIGRINQDLRQISKTIQRHDKQLARLEQQQEQQQQQLKKHQQLLSRQVRASFAMGRQEQMKILLNQEDPGTVQRTLIYYDYLNKARAQHIRQVNQSLQRLTELQTEINQQRLSRQQVLNHQQQKKSELEQSREDRQVALVNLKTEIHTRNRELQEMRRDERELQGLLDSLQTTFADIPAETHKSTPFPKLKGQLPWPAKGPISTTFGSKRAQSGLRWNGVLIKAPSGRDVKAVARGRIAFADWLRGYGLITIIDHGDGYMSLYGHNQSLYKQVGEWVESGEIIASVGDSGGRSKSALYFEIRKQGKPVDPIRWCSARR